MNQITVVIIIRVAKDFSLFKRNILIWMSQQSFHGEGLSNCEKLEFFSWWVLNKKKAHPNVNRRSSPYFHNSKHFLQSLLTGRWDCGSLGRGS